MMYRGPNDATRDGPRRRSWSPASRNGIALLGFLAVAAYFLWTEHEAHLRAAVPYLPFLLLLACPLMHLFMHHGHGGHGSAGDGSHEEPGRWEKRDE